MVSTLHITLSYNQPGEGDTLLGRSASCEETNLLGFSSGLSPTSKATSLSTSSVITGKSNIQNILGPTPYSPTSKLKSPSWSPVRFKPQKLAESRRNVDSLWGRQNDPSQQAGERNSRSREPRRSGGVKSSGHDKKLALVSPTLTSRCSPSPPPPPSDDYPAAKTLSKTPPRSPKAHRPNKTTKAPWLASAEKRFSRQAEQDEQSTKQKIRTPESPLWVSAPEKRFTREHLIQDTKQNRQNFRQDEEQGTVTSESVPSTLPQEPDNKTAPGSIHLASRGKKKLFVSIPGLNRCRDQNKAVQGPDKDSEVSSKHSKVSSQGPTVSNSEVSSKHGKVSSQAPADSKSKVSSSKVSSINSQVSEQAGKTSQATDAKKESKPSFKKSFALQKSGSCTWPPGGTQNSVPSYKKEWFGFNRNTKQEHRTSETNIFNPTQDDFQRESEKGPISRTKLPGTSRESSEEGIKQRDGHNRKLSDLTNPKKTYDSDDHKGESDYTQETKTKESPKLSAKESPGASRKLLGDTEWMFATSSSSSSASSSKSASSTPWRHVPNRLAPTSFQRFEDSVHSGGGNKGVGGGVMEDGGSHAPITSHLAPVNTINTQRKATSLPGYYSRHHHPPHTFREAYLNTKNQEPRGYNKNQEPRAYNTTNQESINFNTSRNQDPRAYTKSPTPPHGSDVVPPAPPRGPTSPRAPRVTAMLAQTQRTGQQMQKQGQQMQQQQYVQQQPPQMQHWPQQIQQQRLQQQRVQQAHQQQPYQQHQYPVNSQGHNEQTNYHKSHHHHHHHHEKESEKTPADKKSKRSLLSGIFRRKKKGSSSSSSSSSSSDSEEVPQRRSFLRRRSKKKERKEPLPPPPPPPPDEEGFLRGGHTRLTSLGDGRDGRDFRAQDGRDFSGPERVLSDGSYRRVRVIPSGTGSLGKESQPLGIPTSVPPPRPLTKIGVSASHDSLPISLGSWGGGGSHGSLGYYSGCGMGMRSSSTDTISKKERRELLKARVERLREKIRDTSSDEDKASVSSHSMYGSESSLSKTGSISRRSRAARTERFLRRKSHELETLRNETEKDRRNREAVQARIEEIQRVRMFEAERNKYNEERKQQMQLPSKTKPKWSAKLVYQESSEYETAVILRTPTASPGASPHMRAKFQGHKPQVADQSDAVIMRNKPLSPNTSITVSLPLPSATQARRSFQDIESPVQNNLSGHRSASYDSNINRNSFLMQHTNGPYTAGPPNRSGLIPPAPPPRDRSRILSPGDGRPMSYSFENLNQEVHRPNSSQSSMSNFTKGSSPSPSVRSVPAYLGPRANNQPQGTPTPMVPTRRSLSELELSAQQQANGAPPARPAPPGYPATQYSYTDQPPRPAVQPTTYYRVQQQNQPSLPPQHQQNSGQVQYYTDQSPQYAKIVPISSVPPSPSSDYSSYMSDNSIRLQQANTAWRNKEQELKSKVVGQTQPAISDSSRSNSPKPSSPGRQQDEEPYGSIQTKKLRPSPITLKQAESLSSLSGQSDVSSPVPKAHDSDSSQGSLARDKKKLAQNRPLSMVLEKSESGDKESAQKGKPQPPIRSATKQITTPRSEVTKRQMIQEIMKQKMEQKKEKNISEQDFDDVFKKEREKLEKSKCSNFEDALKELEEIYASLKLDSEDLLDRAERRDLPAQYQKMWENNHSSSEPSLSGSTTQEHNRRRGSRGSRRSGIPDVKADDMHYRRCQQSSRNQPDVQKALQMTGSYLLVSPAHVSPTEMDKDLPKDPMMEGEPDIVYDDVSYRNIKQANAIKIIDPQPPFGIPLGPTTQGSPNDYLHVTPKENYRPKMMARKQPDTTMDDLAFRNLRKDSGKEVNTSELDELLSEASNDPPRRRPVRSASADRAHSTRGDNNSIVTSNSLKERGLKQQTPRKVKHQNEARRAGRGGSGKDANTDSDATVSASPISSRNNPSWLERAHLVGTQWDNMSTNNLSTSTETLTELSSARAISQPDIRQAIIREARVPPGGPMEFVAPHTVTVTSKTMPPASAATIATITVPKLVKVQTIQSAPVSPVTLDKKPYRPLDSIFNNKPKPFYRADKNEEPKQQEPQKKQHRKKSQQMQPQEQKSQQKQQKEQKSQQKQQKEQKSQQKQPQEQKSQQKQQQKLQQKQQQKSQQSREQQKKAQDHVDIARLDALISTLKMDDTSQEDTSTTCVTPEEPRVTNFDTEELKIKEPAYENEPQTKVPEEGGKPISYVKNSAKANIAKAIRLSMAIESYSSEGNIKEVQSRRRSAVELPVRESLSPITTNSSNFLSYLSINPNRDHDARPDTPPSAPVQATTYTDRVESMVVVSQNVHGRCRRARSVPTSPKTIDAMFDKAFDLLLANDSQEDLASGSEHEQSKNRDTQLASSKVEDGTLNKPLSSANVTQVKDSSSAPKTNINACDQISSSTAILSDLSSVSAGARANQVKSNGTVDNCDHVDGRSKSAEAAPSPPARSSSLPPSPTEQPNTLQEVRKHKHRARGTSVPSKVQGSSTSSDYESDPLPAASHSKQDGSEGRAASSVPRPFSSGEGGACTANDQDNGCVQSLLAACYLLACLTQLAGIDLLIVFGLILAVASMLASFAR